MFSDEKKNSDVEFAFPRLCGMMYLEARMSDRKQTTRRGLGFRLAVRQPPPKRHVAVCCGTKPGERRTVLVVAEALRHPLFA